MIPAAIHLGCIFTLRVATTICCARCNVGPPVAAATVRTLICHQTQTNKNVQVCRSNAGCLLYGRGVICNYSRCRAFSTPGAIQKTKEAERQRMKGRMPAYCSFWSCRLVYSIFGLPGMPSPLCHFVTPVKFHHFLPFCFFIIVGFSFLPCT